MYRHAEDFCWVSILVILQYLVKMCSVVTLDRELQPPAAYLPAEADSLFYQGIQYENEPCIDGLGQIHDIVNSSCMCLYMYVVVNCTEWECELRSYQCAYGTGPL